MKNADPWAEGTALRSTAQAARGIAIARKPTRRAYNGNAMTLVLLSPSPRLKPDAKVELGVAYYAVVNEWYVGDVVAVEDTNPSDVLRANLAERGAHDWIGNHKGLVEERLEHGYAGARSRRVCWI